MSTTAQEFSMSKFASEADRNKAMLDVITALRKQVKELTQDKGLLQIAFDQKKAMLGACEAALADQQVTNEELSRAYESAGVRAQSYKEQLAAMTQERDEAIRVLPFIREERDDNDKAFRHWYSMYLASQSREAALLEALEEIRRITCATQGALVADEALRIPHDTSALDRSKRYAAEVLSKAIDEIDPTWEGLEVLRHMAAQLRKEAGE